MTTAWQIIMSNKPSFKNIEKNIEYSTNINYRVSTLSKLYLTVTRILIPSLNSMGLSLLFLEMSGIRAFSYGRNDLP